MKIVRGKKYILDLHTFRGTQGISMHRHGATVIVLDSEGYVIKDYNHPLGSITWYVNPEMLKPINLIDNQYVFPFMYDE